MALLATIAGCATPTPEPPLLSLADRACDAEPVLQGASPVPFDRAGGTYVKVGAASRCLASAAGLSTPYVVFQLPEAPAPYGVTVASLIIWSALMVPRVTILDAAGAVSRVVEPGTFREDVSGLWAGLRVKPGDRYLVATADVSRIGQPVTMQLSLREQRGVQVAAAVPIFIPLTANIPQQITSQTAVFALNGMIKVSTAPIVVVP